MNIRKATNEDKAAVCEIYNFAKKIMKESGIDQWQDGYPNEESFLDDVKNGIGIICHEGDEVTATAAAYIGNEPTYSSIFQGKWLTDSEKYGIIHRIAVKPSSKKRGIATAVFSYTEEICRKNSIFAMRCDTHRDNKIMQRTLLKNGYTYCGIIYLLNGDERLAYEKILG